MSIVKSVYDNQKDILNAIEKLHCPEGFQCDVTYGNGAFYKHRKEPEFKFDLDPQQDNVIEACSMDLPIEAGVMDNVVFDPPFLTYIKKGREHNSIMGKRFSGYWRYEELAHHYNETAREAYRVLKKGGVFIVKCQDIIHNHKMHCTHAKTIGWCEGEGFRLLDMFVLTAKHRMPVNRGRQKHARIYHSYFLVFKK